jgi:hypothetical protein
MHKHTLHPDLHSSIFYEAKGTHKLCVIIPLIYSYIISMFIYCTLSWKSFSFTCTWGSASNSWLSKNIRKIFNDISDIKGTVSPDYRSSDFLLKHPSMGPWLRGWSHKFEFAKLFQFFKFCKQYHWHRVHCVHDACPNRDQNTRQGTTRARYPSSKGHRKSLGHNFLGTKSRQLFPWHNRPCETVSEADYFGMRK